MMKMEVWTKKGKPLNPDFSPTVTRRIFMAATAPYRCLLCGIMVKVGSGHTHRRGNGTAS